MRIDVPDYGTFVEFPDDTPQDTITRVLKTNFPPKKAGKATTADLVDTLRTSMGHLDLINKTQELMNQSANVVPGPDDELITGIPTDDPAMQQAKAALTTGATSWMPAGGAFFGGAGTPEAPIESPTLGKSADIANELMKSLTYQPTSPEAQGIVADVAYPITWAAETAKESREIWDKWASEYENQALTEKNPEKAKSMKALAEAYRFLGFTAETGGEGAPFIAPTALKYTVQGVKAIGNIGKTTWFRQMTIPERGLVVNTLEDMIGRGYSEAEILRKWNNPQWRAEALARRIKGETIEPTPGEPATVTPVPKEVAPTEKLPPGQGFELMGDPYNAAERMLKASYEELMAAKRLPPPPGMGEGFVMKEPEKKEVTPKVPAYTAGEIPEGVTVEYKPVGFYKTEANAQRALNAYAEKKGVRPWQLEVVPTTKGDKSGFAIQRSQRTIEKEKEAAAPTGGAPFGVQLSARGEKGPIAIGDVVKIKIPETGELVDGEVTAEFRKTYEVHVTTPTGGMIRVRIPKENIRKSELAVRTEKEISFAKENYGDQWPADIEVVKTTERVKELYREYGAPNASPSAEGRIFGKSASVFIDDDTGKPVAFAPSDLAARREKESKVQTLGGALRKIGVDFSKDYNTRELLQDIQDLRNVQRKGGSSPDVALQIIRDEYPGMLPEGITSDDLVEMGKRGEWRTITTEKGKDIVERYLEKYEQKSIEQRMATEEEVPFAARKEAPSERATRIREEAPREKAVPRERAFPEGLREAPGRPGVELLDRLGETYTIKVKGEEVSPPAFSYAEAAKGKKNPWVRRSADPRQDLSGDNSRRTLLIQFASDLIYKAPEGDIAASYYDRLYAGDKPGYERLPDFWEIPQWIGYASHVFPNADVYVIRNMAEAQKLLKAAGYGRVVVSSMDVNKALIKELAKGYDGQIDVGGYAPKDEFAGIPNITWHDTIQSLADSAGVPYREGVDYRHFEGSESIPRLTMSQGCLHKCAFCDVPKKLEVTAPEVINQQADAIAKMGTKLIYLNDKTFGQAANYKDLSDLYIRVKQRNPDFKGFIVQTTAAQMLKIPAEWLKTSGIKYVELGIESYNDPILRELKKPATEALIDRAVDKLRQAGIEFVPNIIIGIPGETAETYQRTLDFLDRNADTISHANIYNLAVYEGTDMAKKVEIKSAADQSENVLEKSFHENPLVHKAFAEKIYKIPAVEKEVREAVIAIKELAPKLGVKIDEIIFSGEKHVYDVRTAQGRIAARRYAKEVGADLEAFEEVIKDAQENGEVIRICAQHELVSRPGESTGSKITNHVGATAKDKWHEFGHALERQGGLPGWAGTAEQHARFLEETLGKPGAGRIPELTEEGRRIPREKAAVAEARPEMAARQVRRRSLGADILMGTPVPAIRSSKVQDIAKYLSGESAKAGVIAYETATPKQNKIVEDTLHDFFNASTNNNPIGALAYRDDLVLALEILGDLDPDIKNPVDNFRLRLALAITSDGNRIVENFDIGWGVYQGWKNGNKFKLQKGSLREDNIQGNLEFADLLSGKFKNDLEFEKWLLGSARVGDIIADLSDKLGISYKDATPFLAGELVNSVVPRSAIFGPKIGSFFANLSGNNSYLTADVWFMRTMGRIQGNLVEEPSQEMVEALRSRLRDALNKAPQVLDRFNITRDLFSTDEDINALARRIKKLSSRKKSRGDIIKTPGGDEVRKASNRLVLALDNAMIDAPENGSHRKWLRDRVEGVRKRVGGEIEAADIQAAVWFGEKELYDAFGAKGSKDRSHFSEGANALHERVLGRPSERYAAATGGVGGRGREVPAEGTLFSARKEKLTSPTKSEVLSKIMEIARTSPGGFTIDISDGTSVTKGYVVAPSKRTELVLDNLTEQAVIDYLDKFRPVFEADDNFFLGGWKNEDKASPNYGKYVLDIAYVTDSIEDATYLAEIGDQDGIHHIEGPEPEARYINKAAAVQRLKDRGIYETSKRDALRGIQESLHRAIKEAGIAERVPTPAEAVKKSDFSVRKEKTAEPKPVSAKEDLGVIRKHTDKYKVVLDPKDAKFIHRIWNSPLWYAEKNSEFKPIFDREMKRENDRGELHDKFLKEWESARNLSKPHLAKLKDIIWKLEGRKLKAVTGHPYIYKEGPEGVKVISNLNTKYLDELKGYLESKETIPPEVIKAYMDIQRHMLKNRARVYNKLATSKDVDRGTIEAYRKEIGIIPQYFPHNRYGNYYIKGTTAGGDTVVRVHYNDIAPKGYSVRAPGMLEKLKKEYPDAVNWEVAKVKGMPEEFYEYPIPVEAMGQIISAAAERVKDVDPGAGAIFEKALPQAVADVIKSRGFGSHFIKRENIPGFEKDDILRVLYDHSSALAGYITKMDAARDFTNMMFKFKGMRKPNVTTYSMRYIRDVMSNTDRIDRAVDTVRSYFFLKYLWGNIKSGTVNLTQGLITTAPRLSMDAGMRGYTVVKTAVEDIVASFTKDKYLKADESKLLTEMSRQGILQDQYAQEVRGQVSGMASQFTNKVLEIGCLPMSITEKLGRAGAALAAYRIARDGHITNKKTLERYSLAKGEKAGYDTAKKYAEEIVNQTFFVYGKGNLPEILRGQTKFLRPLYSLGTFSHNIMQLWAWMFKQGGRGWAGFFQSMWWTLFFGGLMAIPFYKAITSALRQQTGHDPDKAIREAVPDSPVGSKNLLRDITLYGAPAGAGVSVSGSLQIGDIDTANPLKFIIGVPWSEVEGLGRAINAYSSGATSRAVEELMPAAIKNPMAGYRLYKEGQYAVTGKPINLPGEVGPRKLTQMEAVAKGFGFQPVSSTKAYDVNRAMEQLEMFVQKKKTKWANQYANAYNDNDLKKMATILDEVTAWNDKWQKAGHPEFTIRLAESLRQRMKTGQPPRPFRGLGQEYKEAYQ